MPDRRARKYAPLSKVTKPVTKIVASAASHESSKTVMESVTDPIKISVLPICPATSLPWPSSRAYGNHAQSGRTVQRLAVCATISHRQTCPGDSEERKLYLPRIT